MISSYERRKFFGKSRMEEIRNRYSTRILDKFEWRKTNGFDFLLTETKENHPKSSKSRIFPYVLIFLLCFYLSYIVSSARICFLKCSLILLAQKSCTVYFLYPKPCPEPLVKHLAKSGQKSGRKSWHADDVL